MPNLQGEHNLMSTSTLTSKLTNTSTDNYHIQMRKDIAKSGNFLYVGMPTGKGTVRVLNESREWLLVDLNGKPLTKPCTNISPFSEGRAKIKENYDRYQYFMDEVGNKITHSSSLQIHNDGVFSEGLATVVCIEGEDRRKVGFINRRGKLVIPCSFHYATEFSDSVAWVNFSYPSPMGTLFYAINYEGNQTIPYPFKAVNHFVGGVAGVEIFEHYFDFKMRPKKRNPNYVLIDKKGNQLSDRFFYIEEFSEDLAVACFDGVNQILIDKRGKQVTKKYYETLGFVHEGICWAISDNKVFYMDIEENQISPFCDKATNFSEGLGCVRYKGQYFFIDKNGRKAFSQTFDNAEPFNEGVAEVQKDGKVFYIDHTGEPIFNTLNY